MLWRRKHSSRLASIEYTVKEILTQVRSLAAIVSAAEQADKTRDFEMSKATADILAQLDAAKTRDDGFRVILQSLVDNQDNPAALQAIAASISGNEDAWATAFSNVNPTLPAT